MHISRRKIVSVLHIKRRKTLVCLNSLFSDASSHAQFLLSSVLEQHPVMQAVVVNEVEQFIFTKAQSEKAKYYAITFFNQLVYDADEAEVAVQVVLTYMKLFKTMINADKPGKLKEAEPEKTRWSKNAKGNKQKPDRKAEKAAKIERMKQEKLDKVRQMSAEAKHKFVRIILAGIGRAYPFAAKKDSSELKLAVDDLFRLIYSPDFGIVVRAVTLLTKMAKYGEDLDSRLYSSIYQSFLHPKLGDSAKNHSLYLNSVFQSVNRDRNYPNRVKAMLKRMLSLGNVSQSPFIAGILVIAAVVLRGMENVQRASLKQIIMDVEDVESKNENVVKIEADLKAFDGDNEDEAETGGWVFNAVETEAVKNLKIEDETNKKSSTEKSKSAKDVSIKRNGYDPNAWNPLHSGSQYTPLWEILALRNHFHPGVAHLADDLLNLGDRGEYKGDPLEDFTLLKFLDRFAYKNPKDQKTVKNHKFQGITGVGLSRDEIVAVTDAKFTTEDVRDEDVFLQNFFKISKSNKKIKVKAKKEAKEDVEDVLISDDGGSDVDDDEFDKLIGLHDFTNAKGAIDDIDMSDDEEAKEIKDIINFEKLQMEEAEADEKEAEAGAGEQLVEAEVDDELDEENEEFVDADVGTEEAVIGDDKAHKKQKAWEKNRMADNGGKGGKGGRGDKYYANKRKQESGHHTKSKKKK